MPITAIKTGSPVIIGGVDTHKDFHVATIIGANDVVIATEFFSTTRAGYRAMLAWMRGHGYIRRVGIECTGSYGAGLLRFLDTAGIEVLKVTAPDKTVRRKKGKNDTLDAENAAHAAFAGIRTATPKTRDGMVEALRILRVARKTAVNARRISLQMLQTPHGVLLTHAPNEASPLTAKASGYVLSLSHGLSVIRSNDQNLWIGPR